MIVKEDKGRSFVAESKLSRGQIILEDFPVFECAALDARSISDALPSFFLKNEEERRDILDSFVSGDQDQLNMEKWSSGVSPLPELCKSMSKLVLDVLSLSKKESYDKKEVVELVLALAR